jgi:FkbM family methyltransferase
MADTDDTGIGPREAVAESVTVAKAGCAAVRDYLRGSVTLPVQDGRTIEMRSAYFRGFWEIRYAWLTERPLIAAIMDDIGADDVFYDIGANVGIYSCLVGSLGAEVHAFEPNPPAYDDLTGNIERNGLETVEVHKTVVSDTSGPVRFRVQESPKGLSRVADGSTGQEVEAVAIDDLESADPDVVKIDVECHEREVLEGMTGVMERSAPTIYCEVHEQREAVRSLLEEHGYDVEQIDYRAGNTFFRASMS